MDVKSILGQINLKTYLWEITSTNTNVIHWLTTPALIFVYGGLLSVFVFFYNINDLSNKNKETQDGFKPIWLYYFVRIVFHLLPNIGRFRFCKNKRIETGYVKFSLEWARREKFKFFLLIIQWIMWFFLHCMLDILCVTLLAIEGDMKFFILQGPLLTFHDFPGLETALLKLSTNNVFSGRHPLGPSFAFVCVFSTLVNYRWNLPHSRIIVNLFLPAVNLKVAWLISAILWSTTQINNVNRARVLIGWQLTMQHMFAKRSHVRYEFTNMKMLVKTLARIMGDKFFLPPAACLSTCLPTVLCR